MTTVVWANILLAIPFLIAVIGIPLWMTFKRPQTGPDHAEARTYLRTRVTLASALTRGAAARRARTLARNESQRVTASA